MKKTITAIAVLLAVLLGSCAETGGGEAQNSAQSSAEATAQTEAVTKDAETSALEDPNAVTTDMDVPSETKETDAAPAFDINDESCLPYRLAEMTYSEIEAEFGPLNLDEWWYGGSPVYTSDKLDGIKAVFITVTGDLKAENGFPAASPEDYPTFISVGLKEYSEDNPEYVNEIYPGYKYGMSMEEALNILYAGEEPDSDANERIVEWNPIKDGGHGCFLNAADGDEKGLCLWFDFSEDTIKVFGDEMSTAEGDSDKMNAVAENFRNRIISEKLGTISGYRIYHQTKN